MAIEYAVRVATGEYTLEMAKRQDLLKKQARLDVEVKAGELAKRHRISIGLARNVVVGRYSLEIAKRKERRRRRQGNGKSSDLFVVGRRLQGSFGSNQ